MCSEKQFATVGLLGVPWDAHSSFRRGAADAPARIRQWFYSDAGNLCTESGLDLGDERRWRDLGDLVMENDAEALAVIEEAATTLLTRGMRLVSLGGDHAVTYPLIRACAGRYPGIHILHLDAHPDLYDSLLEDRFSHACPFARIMEEKLVAGITQVGVRAATPHQREQAERFGVRMVEMCHFRPDQLPALEAPVYLSLDLDALDPAHAPGVAHPEPGGLTTRDVIAMIQALSGKLAGADIVEYNPTCDVNDLTARVAAKLVKEVIAAMLG
jgi:arginase